MSRYLIVAHQTAASSELRKCVKDLMRADPESEFAILIPATQNGFHMVANEVRAREESMDRATESRAMLEDAGAKVLATHVGSSNPLLAIEDELRQRPDYDALVISTLPSGVSHWLKQDLPHKATKFGLPVHHVVSQARVPAHA